MTCDLKIDPSAIYLALKKVILYHSNKTKKEKKIGI